MLAVTAPLTYFQAIVLGVLQGVTELFPVSSLGHSVLLPSLFGWDNLVKAQSQTESFFLAFLVGLHVATALALLVYFWRDWDRIIRGFFRSLRDRQHRRRRRRPPGLAADHRHHPGRARRPDLRALAARRCSPSPWPPPSSSSSTG